MNIVRRSQGNTGPHISIIPSPFIFTLPLPKEKVQTCNPLNPESRLTFQVSPGHRLYYAITYLQSTSPPPPALSSSGFSLLLAGTRSCPTYFRGCKLPIFPYYLQCDL